MYPQFYNFIVKLYLIFHTIQRFKHLINYDEYYHSCVIPLKHNLFLFYPVQLWRLVTNFLFFGPIGFNFLFNMIFTYRYCRMLEEGSFRGRTADFFFMFFLGGLVMTVSFNQDFQ